MNRGGASRSQVWGQIGATAARRRWSTALLTLGLGLLPVRVTLGEPGAPDPREIQAFVERQARLSRLPAVAVAIVDGSGELYAEGFGSGEGRPTPATPFLLGSVSKTFTALAIAQLVDRGQLAFDDPVITHLADFKLASSDGGRTVTVRHLLHHVSGLSQWSGHDRRAQRLGRFDHVAPKAQPGARFEYSSLNYIVLGRLIEVVSGLSYGEYIRQNIFVPLEMSASYADLEVARRNGLIGGHRFFYGLPLAGREAAPPAPLVPAGFLVSSARDLGNYLSMLLRQGRFREHQVVSAGALAEIFKPWRAGGALAPRRGPAQACPLGAGGGRRGAPGPELSPVVAERIRHPSAAVAPSAPTVGG